MATGMILADQSERLAQHEAFEKLGLKELNRLLRAGEFVVFPAQAVLCREGEAAEFVYFVLSGEIQLTVGTPPHIITAVGAFKGCFGWNAYESTLPYQATVLSQQAQLFRIPATIAEESLRYKHLDKELFLYRIPLGAYFFFKSLNLPIFNVTHPEFLTAFQIEFFKERQDVVRAGEQADKFFMIAHGSAAVVKGNESNHEGLIRNYLEVGDYFGEVGLLTDSLRTASVVATHALTVFSLSKKDFELFLSTREGRLVSQYLQERIKTYGFAETLIMGSAPDCSLRIEGVGVAPRHAKLLKSQTGDGITYMVKPLANLSQYKVFVNKQPIQEETILHPYDELFIGNYEIVIDHKRDRISAHETGYHSLRVEQLLFELRGQVLLDKLSFDAYSNELVCIMGPSGCGKSTLLDLIYGARRPNGGQILYDNVPLHDNLEFYRDIFGFVPQDDVLLNELTVFENLYYAAKLREPKASFSKLEAKIDSVLELLKLSHRKHSRVGGGEQQKVLSGGERKRVNIARELVFEPHIFFLDEPTSGLSSKDAEEVVEFLRKLVDMGKLVITVLHQPNSRIFEQFDKIILLDKGGKLVFTGPSLDCIAYMKKTVEDHTEVLCRGCGTCQPDLIFDVLERPSTEERHARQFSPEFWQQRFIELGSNEKDDDDELPDTRSVPPAKPQRRKRRKNSWAEDFGQLWTLTRRHFAKRWNDRTNMLISLLSAPAIAGLVAYILRYTPESGVYSFSQNVLVPQYLFLGVIVTIFLGLTNSARDIVGEQSIYQREIKTKLKNHWYVLSKFAVLALIAAIQTASFIVVGNTVLDIKGVFWPFFYILYLAALCGVSFGLCLSAMFRSAESVVNWIPLVLIPQIILGGALIEYKEMNQKLYLRQSERVIPEICQVMPSRWAYEALMVAQVEQNPRIRLIESLNQQRETLGLQLEQLSNRESPNDAQATALQTQLEALDEQMGEVENQFPEVRYVNEKLTQAVNNGSGEYMSNQALFEKQSTWGLNDPFLASKKAWVWGKKSIESRTVIFNTLMLLSAILGYLMLCISILGIKHWWAEKR